MSARKPYVKPQPRNWWTAKPFFFWYMVREATSLFVASYAVLLITGLWALAAGPGAWSDWLQLLAHPVLIAWQLLTLAAVLYHAVTWFRLAPSIMVVRVGDWTLPARVMLVGQWLGLCVCSAGLLALMVGV